MHFSDTYGRKEIKKGEVPLGSRTACHDVGRCDAGRCAELSVQSWPVFMAQQTEEQRAGDAGYISFSPSYPLSTDFPSVGVQPACRVGLHAAVNPWDSFHSQVKECLPYRILNAIRLPIEAAVLLSAV